MCEFPLGRAFPPRVSFLKLLRASGVALRGDRQLRRASAQQHVEDAMADLAQAESEDTHRAAYDEYLSEWSANQIKELGTHFEDFRTSICTAACDRSPFEPGAHPEPSSLLTR